MKEFEIYFELFGKKMKTTISATGENEAKELVKSKIIFHKVKQKKSLADEMKDEFDKLMDILNDNS